MKGLLRVHEEYKVTDFESLLYYGLSFSSTFYRNNIRRYIGTFIYLMPPYHLLMLCCDKKSTYQLYMTTIFMSSL